MTNLTPCITILLLLASNILMTFAWYGHSQFSAAELKTIQEVITLAVFVIFFGFL